MSKHTPGPWQTCTTGEVTTKQEDDKPWRRIAVVQDYGGGSVDEVDKANARLMAAAPDMLKALMQLVSELDEHREWVSDDTFDQACWAITDATGE